VPCNKEFTERHVTEFHWLWPVSKSRRSPGGNCQGFIALLFCSRILFTVVTFLFIQKPPEIWKYWFGKKVRGMSGKLLITELAKN